MNSDGVFFKTLGPMAQQRKRHLSSEKGEDARFRAAQVRVIERNTPVAMLANIANTLVAIGVLYPEHSDPFLAVWSASIILLASLGLTAWYRGRNRVRRRASVRTVHRAILHAAVLGGLWGFLPAIWFPDLSGTSQTLVVALMTGMLCGGAFVLATIPSAASAYVLTITFGCIVGLLRDGIGDHLALMMLLVPYTATILAAVFISSRSFAEYFDIASELKENSEVIALLLNEFEEKGSDWLFELDLSMNLVNGSSRLLEILRLQEFRSRELRFPDLLCVQSKLQLIENLSAVRPFRDLIVRTGALQEERWWSLAGSPILSENGITTGWRGVGSDVTDAKAAEERMRWFAQHDPLTGIPNRAQFTAEVSASLEKAKQTGQEVAVAILDLDRFKKVNDTLGHHTGDELLVSVADRLSSIAKKDFSVGRLGGDEFGLTIPSKLGREGALQAMQDVISEISNPYTIGNSKIVIGGSAGLAFSTDGCADVDGLMRNADLALYLAKERPGDVVAFDAQMRRVFDERNKLLEDLQLAVENGELRLLYQPIIDAQTSKVHSLEALLRWHHKELGAILPDKFIPLAETSGCIHEIGKWVIQEACHTILDWPQDVKIAVNVSPLQLTEPGFVDFLEATLRDMGLSPDRIELEITEAVFVNYETEAEKFATRVNDMGIRIALDDFGTGYSSFGYLARFPVQKLKVDRAFISGNVKVRDKTAIVSAIVSIARSLGMKTVAEGVETEEQLSWIREMGCDQAQGYLISKPVEKNDILAIMDRKKNN